MSTSRDSGERFQPNAVLSRGSPRVGALEHLCVDGGGASVEQLGAVHQRDVRFCATVDALLPRRGVFIHRGPTGK